MIVRQNTINNLTGSQMYEKINPVERGCRKKFTVK